MSAKTALIMRATGYQAKGTIKQLVKKGWNIHALVKDANADRAVALKSMGKNVTLFEGSWQDPESIKTAIKGCQALLFNQLPEIIDDSGIREAKTVLDIAKAAGVQIVFPTTFPLENPNFREDYKDSSTAPNIFIKDDVEQLVKASGLTWTIFRPGYFMTNFLSPLMEWVFPEFKDGRKFVNSFGPNCVLVLTDPDDIGMFMAAAFENPEKFAGKTIPIVSENMRVDKMLEMLEEVSGKPVKPVYRTEEETEKLKDNHFVASCVLVRELDKFVKMDEIKSWGIPLTTFKEFLEKHKDEL